MATRMPMVLRLLLTAPLVLGTASTDGAESHMTEPTGSPVARAEPLPDAFGGTWEMDLRCTAGDSKSPSAIAAVGAGDAAAGGARSVPLVQAAPPSPRNTSADPRHAHAEPASLARALGLRGRAPAQPPAAAPTTVVATGAGHHESSIAPGTRYTLQAGGFSERWARPVAAPDSLPLDAGWASAQLHVAGSVPLNEEIPCAATAEEVISMLQQQDLLRLEGVVCLGDDTSGCHDHFVVIVTRRRGTMGLQDDGQIVIFALDAGGQYSTGRRIRSLQDAAAYGGHKLKHAGSNHGHEGTGD